ncbi:MAG: prepilin-type N-terminal cleavage/methylation domain-containing protein [Thermodesulfobacteriota bacterium]|nr:prepilin-type N-terminal cleavage/methylation domain-containing protein [Thermodesulfobacteriota bacterium]
MKNSLNSKGFTLIEVLVALVILAVSLLALAGMMTTTTKNNAFGGNLTEAATLAQDRLEELRVTDWDNIVNGSNASSIRGLNYNRTWTVVLGPSSPPSPNDNEKRVTVTVDWNDGMARSISFLTVITR